MGDEATPKRRNDDARPRTPKVTTRAVLSTIAVSAAVVHVAQTVAGEYALAGVVAFALVAAWVFGARLYVLKSVRTAVILMVAISLACVLATLTVQRPQLAGAGEEDYRGTVAYAWAHLLVKASHPWPRTAELAEGRRAQLDDLEAAFGAEYAKEERRKANKGALAAVDKERAQQLADKGSGAFAILYRAADGIGFTDAYGAWWFGCLFYLLAANLAVGAVSRRKVSVRNLGFHAAHLGLILVVAGATGSAFLARRGFVALEVDRTTERYASRDTGKTEPLEFSLRLDRFDTQYHEDLVVVAGSPASGPMGSHHGFGGGEGGGVQRTVKLEAGKQFELHDPATGAEFVMTMEEITEAAGLARTMVAGDPGAEIAVSAVLLQLGSDEGNAVWLRSGDPPLIDARNRYKVRVADGADDPTRRDFACDAAVGEGTFTLTTAGNPVRVPVVSGESAAVGSFTVEFGPVYPNFRVGVEEVSADDFPRNPALRARITDGGGRSGDYLFFSEQRLKDFTTLPWEGVEGSFDYDFWCSPTHTRVELRVGPDGNVTARVQLPDGTESEARIGSGSSVAGLEPTLVRGLHAAREEWTLVDDPPEGVPMHTALRLAADGPEGLEEHWLLSNTPQGALRLGEGGEGLFLQLADNRDRPPRDWRSHVSVLEEGHVVHSSVVEVNEPLSYGGFSFFQSDADPSRPNYSGLQVVRDPAWPLVAAGLWALLLGIAWCFYVQPVMDRRAARARAAAAGGAR